tara:strand:- start:141 stop:395 length:255 start_codon:yes stop_codon:yes gene_type:complete
MLAVAELDFIIDTPKTSPSSNSAVDVVLNVAVALELAVFKFTPVTVSEAEGANTPELVATQNNTWQDVPIAAVVLSTTLTILPS